MERWFLHTKKADFNAIAEKFKISPMLARIIRNRDITEESAIHEFLNGSIDNFASPWLLKDMDRAVQIVLDKIKQGSHIRIIGDYDIDGICSTYILVHALSKIGAVVDIDIPDRMTDGYGINETLIDRAYEAGIDTIITCDNGIAAINSIKYAKGLGLTVIVTDHHNIPFVIENGEKIYLIPSADAVVNPKQPDCTYPFKELCGASVAYKLIEATYKKMGLPKREYQNYLEFAAIATIGDVVDLIGENRTIAKYGLRLLNKTENIGLSALIQVNNLQDKEIKSYHIGFILGPCLNASGRLSTAKLALSLLNEDDKNKAFEKAKELEELNISRKEMTLKAVEEAIHLVESTELIGDNILVVYLPECHESIAGIVAGRIKEKYNKPSIVLTKSESCIKGSGRSIEAYNMADELNKCKDILIKFGGHPMAAGLSLSEENIDILRISLNRNSSLTEDDLQKKLWIDMAIPFEYVNENFITELSLLEPFGKANEKPVFAEKNVRVKRLSVFGENKNVLRFDFLNKNNYKINAIAFDNENTYMGYLIEKFGAEEIEKAKKGRKNNINISVVYYPQINEYNGIREVRLMITKIR